MKNRTAADLLEKSLPFYRPFRFALSFAFVASAAMSLHGELMEDGFDRNLHWLWVAFGGGFLLMFMIQCVAEGEAQRLRDIGDED